MAEKGFKRKLAALLSADVEGYSRPTGENEGATVRKLTAYPSAKNILFLQQSANICQSKKLAGLQGAIPLSNKGPCLCKKSLCTKNSKNGLKPQKSRPYYLR